MASGILGITLSGLYAAQAGIRTTQNNISNVNTEGYHRQEVLLSNAIPNRSGNAFFGNGVDVEGVRRVYSQFLDNEVRLNQTNLARDAAYADYAGQIDRLLGDENGGLNTALSSFFGSVNDLTADPTSFAAREALLAAGRNLSSRMQNIDGFLRNMSDVVNKEIVDIGDRVTALARRLVTINGSIAAQEGSGVTANDLRDQRDQLVSQINELVNVQVATQSDGTINLYLGSGQPLVVGNTAYSLTVDKTDPKAYQPALSLGGSTIPLDSSSISGGRLGGLLAMREQVLAPTLSDLNRVAVAIAAEFNRVHNLGVDYDLQPGVDFFAPVVQQTGGITAGWVNVGLTANPLANENYSVTTADGVNFTVTRASDSASVSVTAGAEVVIGGVAQGFSLAAGVPAPANGESWQLNFQDYAHNMAVEIRNPDQIAAAAASAGGPGDNSNALLLANLQHSGFMNGATFQGSYAQMVSTSANRASEANISRNANETLVRQAQDTQQSLSGVNLDEEAVNLIRFQQAYQAAARAMQVASSLFDEVLSIVR